MIKQVRCEPLRNYGNGSYGSPAHVYDPLREVEHERTEMLWEIILAPSRNPDNGVPASEGLKSRLVRHRG